MTAELLISGKLRGDDTRYCRDPVSSCNIYTVQQDIQSVLMSEFIHHVC